MFAKNSSAKKQKKKMQKEYAEKKLTENPEEGSQLYQAHVKKERIRLGLDKP